jgi:hypothetical protein
MQGQLRQFANRLISASKRRIIRRFRVNALYHYKDAKQRGFCLFREILAQALWELASTRPASALGGDLDETPRHSRSREITPRPGRVKSEAQPHARIQAARWRHQTSRFNLPRYRCFKLLPETDEIVSGQESAETTQAPVAATREPL